MEEAVVGIDLGTTNSCVATIQGGRPKIIEDERGYNILPSCVAFKAHGKFVVGHGAKALILTNPTQTVYAVKRLIGRKFSSAEVQEARKRLSYEIFQGDADDVVLRLGEVELTPEEVSSIVLKCAREVAERSLGRPVTQAVITVPAYFNHAQRKATLQSAELAGLDCLRLLNEPTAAALAYGFKKDLDKKVAIYDLGGGTFDISILEIGGGIYETLGTSGNTFLGGEDFDYRIVDYLADQFRQQHGVDLRENAVSMQRLKDASERAKCELSFVDKTPILIPRVHEDLNLEMSLNRTTLESLVDDLVRESVKITSEALNEANLSIEELDEIILVGGMTRMPKIQESIRVFFGMSPCKGVHPEEVVATGAAVQAFSLEEEADAHVLLDVTPFSLGIDTAGGYFSKVIERNTTLPVGQGRTFTTVTDNQEVVKIVVRQGESDAAADNEFLGEFSLEGIRPGPRMTPRIDVDFKIDANGILHVSAVDRDTGEQQMVTIRDFVDKAASVSATDVQLAADLAAATTRAVPSRDGQPAPPVTPGAEAGGLFGRLKGLFGKGTPDVGDGTEVQDRDGTVADTDVMDRGTPVDGTDVQRRDDGATASAMVVDDQLPAPAGPDPGIAQQLKASLGDAFGRTDPSSQEVQRREAFDGATAEADDKTDPYGIAPTGWAGTAPPPAAAPASPEDRTDPYGIAPAGWTDSAATPPPAPPADPEGVTEPRNVAPAGWSEDDRTEPGGGAAADSPFATGATPTGFAEQPTSPGRPGGAPSPFAADDGDTAAGSDPFALQDRSSADAAGEASSGSPADPFAIRDAGATPRSPSPDPFGSSEPQHSRRVRKVDTRASTSAGITPASFNLAEDPKALAASKKRPARLKIRYKRTRTFVKEFRDNLERGGTFVKTSSPLEVGRRCIFELRLPDVEDPLRLRGMVVWSSRGMDKLPDGQVPGMGIQYDEDDQEGLDGVREAVERFADA